MHARLGKKKKGPFFERTWQPNSFQCLAYSTMDVTCYIYIYLLYCIYLDELVPRVTVTIIARL